MTGPRYDRRQMLTGSVGALTALGMAKSKLLRAHGHSLVQRAASAQPAGSDLEAVEHVVFLMHENRSFDHYFGALGGVNHGFNEFDAGSPVWSQQWGNSTLWPFHLDTTAQAAECTYDLSHTWQAEHASWNGGAMDSFVSTHTLPEYEGPDYGTLTMGYYEQADIPFYYELAKNFTICDKYFCSVLGPTHPNRMVQMTGTLDPNGVAGGPILTTSSDNSLEFTCSWETMPEVLSAHNVSWKVYNPHGKAYRPLHHDSMLLCKNVLMYFEQYRERTNARLNHQAFGYYGPSVKNDLFGSTGVNNFARDVMRNKLPAVSWVIPPDGYDEHPPAPSALGEWYTAEILATLMKNPKVWASTVLFVMYDENDGWFDHVAPPTAPPGTPGEFIGKHPLPSDAGGITGPLGLGFRVPMLVVSPFSAGGWVCSDTFDHTSQLQFLAARFGVPVPNVSDWRRGAVGDLTTALPNLTSPNNTVPLLPATADSVNVSPVVGECIPLQITEANYPVPPLGVPATQVAPVPGAGTLTPTPS